MNENIVRILETLKTQWPIAEIHLRGLILDYENALKKIGTENWSKEMQRQIANDALCSQRKSEE